MTKKIISLLLVLTLVFTSLIGVDRARAADSTMDTLYYLVNKFPHGKFWNHMGSKSNSPDSVTNTPCASHSRCDWRENACQCNSFDKAIQCMGYAYKISYEITGKSARTYTKSKTLKASSLRVGDVIRYRGDKHSLCVTGIKGNRISFTDCNWIGKCQIRWGEMDISDIMGFTYVLHLSGNNRKNTDLDFYKDAENSDYDVEEVTHEVWDMNDEGNLNIRYDRSTDSDIIGRVKKGSEFKVYDKYDDGKYLWGKVISGSTVGWCVLEYAEYKSGSIEKPDFTGLKKSYYAKESFTLKWKEVSGAEKYTIYLYNSDKELIEKYTSKSESKKITIDGTGKYYVKVKATNSKAPSWSAKGSEKSFKIEKSVPVDKVFLEKDSISLPKGDSITLKADISPESASDKSVTYKSSNTKVATVSSSGKVTAKGVGTAKITCTSKDNSKAKDECTIKVVPAKVTGVKQSAASSSEITVKWSKVSGADKYEVHKYNSKTEKYELLGTTSKTEYKLKGEANSSVKVKIRAVEEADGKSYKGAYSSAVTLITSTSVPKLKATAGKAQVKLTWDKVSGATGYAVYQYKDGEYKKIKTLTSKSTSYTVKELKKGKTYSFKIRAVKKTDTYTANSAYSSVVKAKVQIS